VAIFAVRERVPPLSMIVEELVSRPARGTTDRRSTVGDETIVR
jgi:hypothetical protein